MTANHHKPAHGKNKAEKSKQRKREAEHSAVPAAAQTRSRTRPWIQDVIGCAVILLAVFVMFNKMILQGKDFSRGDDTESSRSIMEFVERETAKGEYPLWNPHAFGGFPGHAAGMYFNHRLLGMPYSLANTYLSPHNWSDEFIFNVLFFGWNEPRFRGARVLLVFLLYAGLFTYFLMRKLGFNPAIGAFCGLLMSWNPYLISLATAAHGGKLMTFVYTPLILYLTWNLIRRRRLLDVGLLALAVGWQMAYGSHTQILYYTYLMIGLVYLVWLVMELREKPSAAAFLPGVLLAGAMALGLAAGSLWYIPLSKYVGYSIRGMGPALAEAAQGGYSLEQATMWSFAPKEMITFLVPSWFGLKSPFYWGPMPFTSSSFYFGAVPLLFAVLAFFGKRNRLMWALLVVSIFSLLLSFGRHFEIFYSFFFNVLPFFNKFRTPSLILLLLVLSGVILSAYGIRFVMNLEDDKKWKKVFLGGVIASAVILVLVLVSGDALSGSFGSMVKAEEAGRYSPQQMAQIHAYRFDMLRKDLMLAMVWLALGFAVCYLKTARKITGTVFLAGILLITTVDIWRFSHQFFDPQPASTHAAGLQENQIIRKLREDHSIYRVYPLGRLAQDNRWTAWGIDSFGGYHGAKMRSYQDLIDYVLPVSSISRIPFNLNLLSAMNCKYLITEGALPDELHMEQTTSDPATGQILYRNPRALDRVYFVDSVEVIPDRKDVIHRLMQPGFMYDYQAIINNPLPGPIRHHPERQATITDYSLHEVTIEVQAPEPSFMVMSDANYEPGWIALDNGLPTELYTVNGYVRGVYVTKGNHTIKFRYTGKYEHAGMVVATISRFLVWGIVIAGLYTAHRRRKKVISDD